MLEEVDKLHELIEERRGRAENHLSISATRGLAGQARRKLLQLVGAANPTTRPFFKLARAMQDVWKLPRRQSENDGKRLLSSSSIAGFIEHARERGMTNHALVEAFLKAAAAKEAENRSTRNIRALQEGVHEVCALALPGTLTSFHDGEAGSNHQFLYNNQAENWLRLVGVSEPVEYDKLHQMGLYIFTASDRPTDFATRAVMQCRDNMVTGKDMLEIGPGNGADAELFLTEGNAKSVEIVDCSQFVLERLKSRRCALPEGTKERLVVPDEAQDMSDALRHLESRGDTYDTVYSNSALHFLDDARLRELLGLISRSIRPEGHLAFAVKAPGATLDGPGIPLIRDQQKTGNPVMSGIQDRAYLNPDGQIRHYRSMDQWESMLCEHFIITDATRSLVQDYATPGSVQTFFNFVCRVKPEIINLSGESE